MAGLTKDTPIPIEIKLHKQSRILDIKFSDGKEFQYTCEFLRVHSPSAEVSGHGPGQAVLQTGKKMVNIILLFTPRVDRLGINELYFKGKLVN